MISTIWVSREGIWRSLLAAVALSAFMLSAAIAADEAKNPPQTESPQVAIRASADAFIKAFNRGDAKAVAAMWTAEGSLADESGKIFKGRKAIEAQYGAFFKQNAGAKIEVAVQAVELAAPGTAIEDGTARVVTKDGAGPSVGRYTAVHMLQDGKWLMASVRESSLALPSNFDRLRELAWLVGDWETKSGEAVISASFRWIADKSFLQREYKVRRNGLTESSGVQIIGWDAQLGRVRSWSFDSSGGHGAGLWTPEADGWAIESNGMLADGTPTSSRDVLVRVANEDNVLGWRSSNRKLAGEALPDTREVVMKRVVDKKKR